MKMAVDVDKVESTFFVPFQKFEEQSDGSVMVYGLASGPDVDLDGQLMDEEWLKQAMPNWMMRGNIREMHQPKAVGKAKEYQWTEEGPYVSSKIIDPDAIKKVKEGVYTGYSIGVKNAKVVLDGKAPGGRITDGTICEVSLVDYPAYPHSKFALVKSLEKGVWQDMQTNAILEPVTAEEEKAAWSGSDVDSLPDSSFAYISPGGKKDKDGKTTPRSLRHLPYKDASGKQDAAHVRNALARLSQTQIPESAKASARKKLVAAAKKLGIEVSGGDEKGVKKAIDLNDGAGLSPEAEAKDAQGMQQVLDTLQSTIPALQDLMTREAGEVAAGDMDDVEDVIGLKQTLDSLCGAIQSLCTVLQHEQSETSEEKTLTTGSGLSAPNLDGKPKKEEKAVQPDIKKVGRKMSKVNSDRISRMMTNFKDVMSEMEAFMKELGDSTFEGGESNNEPENEGGGAMKQSQHQEPDTAEALGALKGAGTDLLAKAISDAITTTLTKTVEVKEQPKQENEALNAILEKFNSIDHRLQKIENQPATPEIDVMPVERGALGADTKKNYQGALSNLASQISDLNDKEREKLAAELIKTINGR
jgi:hypothetical protein